MKKLFKKIAFTFLASCLFLTPTFILSACSIEKKIILANFESYMDEGLIDLLNNEYKTQVLPFQNSEEVKKKFERYYDIAIPTTYTATDLIELQQVAKIDWERFNIKNTDTGEIIKNGTDALNSPIFTESIKSMVKEIDNYYHSSLWEGKYLYPISDTLLDYCLPYFLQHVGFAYKGSKIESIEKAKTVSELLYAINHDEEAIKRFKTNNNKIAIIDDARTIFGLARMAEDQSNNINPSDQHQRIDDYKKTYDAFFKDFGQGNLIFDSDSGNIINAMSKPQLANDNFHDDIVGAFTYNGDLLYAAQGGGLYDDVDQWATNDNYHFSKLQLERESDKSSQYLMMLDVIVINKKNQNNEKKWNKIHEIIKTIALDGCELNSEQISEKVIDESTKEEYYKYWTMTNFDYLQYITPLNNINNYVLNGDFWASEDYDQNRELLKSVYLSPNEIYLGRFEMSIDDKKYNDMFWGFRYAKEEL